MILFITNTIALWLMSYFITHISFDKPMALVLTAVALTIIETFVKPILKFLSFPVTVLTLGLFNLVINAFVLYLAFKFVDGAHIDSNLFSMIFASIVLAILASIIQSIL